jgi:hypothetical protein
MSSGDRLILRHFATPRSAVVAPSLLAMTVVRIGAPELRAGGVL